MRDTSSSATLSAGANFTLNSRCNIAVEPNCRNDEACRVPYKMDVNIGTKGRRLPRRRIRLRFDSNSRRILNRRPCGQLIAQTDDSACRTRRCRMLPRLPPIRPPTLNGPTRKLIHMLRFSPRRGMTVTSAADGPYSWLQLRAAWGTPSPRGAASDAAARSRGGARPVGQVVIPAARNHRGTLPGWRRGTGGWSARHTPATS